LGTHEGKLCFPNTTNPRFVEAELRHLRSQAELGNE
jgi:hypothetical protein